MKKLSPLFTFLFFPYFTFCMDIPQHDPIITQAILVEHMWYAGLLSHNSICALALASKEFNKAVQKTASQRKRYLMDQEKYTELFTNKYLVLPILWHKNRSAYAYCVRENTNTKTTFYMVLLDDKEKIITYEKQEDMKTHGNPYLYLDKNGNASFIISVFRNTGFIYNMFGNKQKFMEYTLSTKGLQQHQCTIDWQSDNQHNNHTDISALQLYVKKVIPHIRTDFFIKDTYIHDQFYIGGSFSKNITLLDSSSGTQNGHLAAHTNFIRCCIDAQKGNILVSGSSDETIKIWDTRTNTLKASFDAADSDRIQQSFTDEALCLAQEGDHFCSSTLTNSIYIRDLETGHFIWTVSGRKIVIIHFILLQAAL